MGRIQQLLNVRCCTGYELLKVTVTIAYSSTGGAGGAPLNVTCPAGKYLLDLWPEFPEFGEFTLVDGSLTMSTLPDGRVLPTGWSGKVWQNFAPNAPPYQQVLTFRCIYA